MKYVGVSFKNTKQTKNDEKIFVTVQPSFEEEAKRAKMGKKDKKRL
ncbi:MAG: hypothetical protein J2P31_02955 [Blastocatellia bacterium]|nr:hypothetical protein [Blastocatellia bacterium]